MSGNPELQITSLTKDEIKFTLKNVDLSFANTLRRILIAEVPTMAIEEVKIYANTSPLYDEYIAHRLGLIPLVSSDVEKYFYRRECNCKPSDQCESCRVGFRLTMKCTTEDTLDVTTMDLKPINPKQDENDVRPVKFYNLENKEIGIPIIKLKKNQEIDLECQAEKGIGKIHSKWSPVALANFQYEPSIKLDEKINDLSNKDKEELLKSCPKKIFSIDEKTNKIILKNPHHCMFCNECVKKLEKLNIIDAEKIVKIGQLKNVFHFSVETSGSLKPQEIIKSAFSVIKKKLEEIRNCLAPGTR